MKMTKKEIIKLLKQANDDCSNVEVCGVDGRWRSTKAKTIEELVSGLCNNQYRIKPEPEFVPYTKDDWKEFLGKQFKHHYTGVGLLPIDHDTEGVFFMFEKKARLYPYADLLKEYLHVDGTPAGLRVE